jgi:hypothetical protein
MVDDSYFSHSFASSSGDTKFLTIRQSIGIEIELHGKFVHLKSEELIFQFLPTSLSLSFTIIFVIKLSKTIGTMSKRTKDSTPPSESPTKRADKAPCSLFTSPSKVLSGIKARFPKSKEPEETESEESDKETPGKGTKGGATAISMPKLALTGEPRKDATSDSSSETSEHAEPRAPSATDESNIEKSSAINYKNLSFNCIMR